MKNTDEFYLQMISRSVKADHESFDKTGKYLKSVQTGIIAPGVPAAGYLL